MKIQYTATPQILKDGNVFFGAERGQILEGRPGGEAGHPEVTRMDAQQ